MFVTSSVFRGGHCAIPPPLDITNTRNQRQIQLKNIFFKIIMYMVRKIDITEEDSK